MSPFSRHLLVLATGFMLVATLGLRAADTANTAEAKRIADRYALTKARISALLDQRLTPTPLPANPPNPFYQAPKEATGEVKLPGHEQPEDTLIPETADLSDIDSLKKFAAALKIGGVINRNGNLHLTVNNTPCRVGDVITVGSKDRPVYLKMLTLTPTEFSLALNEATLVVPLRK